jgi:hypothetical protein
VLEVLAGGGILFVRESAHEHPLDFRLPGQFFELWIVKKYFRPGDMVFVQFDPNVLSVFVQFRGALERPMNMALGIALRGLSKARFIEPCLTTKFI